MVEWSNTRTMNRPTAVRIPAGGSAIAGSTNRPLSPFGGAFLHSTRTTCAQLINMLFIPGPALKTIHLQKRA